MFKVFDEDETMLRDWTAGQSKFNLSQLHKAVLQY